MPRFASISSAVLLVAFTIVGIAGSATVVVPVPKSIAVEPAGLGLTPSLSEKDNRALLPEGTPAAAWMVESSSAIVPKGSTGCPQGCAVIGYGSPGATLMRGALDCLGSDGCMKPVALPLPPAPDLIRALPTVRGKVACVVGPAGATTYATPVGTDTSMLRTAAGTLLYSRVAIRYFALADPAKGCPTNPDTSKAPILSRPVNMVYRSTDGGASWVAKGMLPPVPPGVDAKGWPALKKGDVAFSSGLDRTEFFRDPYSDALYLTGGASCPRAPADELTSPWGGVCWSVIFESDDDGITWRPTGPSATFGYGYGAWVPLQMAATAKRVYVVGCANETYPGVGHPTLRWRERGSSVWKSSTGSALDGYECNGPTEAHLPPGYESNDTTWVQAAPLPAQGATDVLRLAFPRREASGRTTLEVLAVTVGPAGVGASEMFKVVPLRGGSILHGGLVPSVGSTPTLGKQPAVALLWWLEGAEASERGGIRARYRLVGDVNSFAPIRDLATSGGVPSIWRANPPLLGTFSFMGDYDDASFARDTSTSPPTYRWLVTWSQSDLLKPTAPNLRLHYNVVSLPEPPPAVLAVGGGPSVLGLLTASAHAPGTVCPACPHVVVSLWLDRAGPVSGSVGAAGGKGAAARFSVAGKAGLNVIVLGGGRPPAPGARFALRVTGPGGTASGTVSVEPRRAHVVKRTRPAGVRDDQVEAEPGGGKR